MYARRIAVIQYTVEWENGDETQKRAAAEKADAIRAKYRASHEHPMGDGNTGVMGYPYANNWYYITNAKFSAGNSKAVDITVHAGVGLSYSFKVAGVGIDTGAAMYYDLTSETPTQTLAFNADIGISDLAGVGASFSSTVDAGTKEHLYFDNQAGLSFGGETYGIETNTRNSANKTFDIVIGGYFIGGAEIIITVDPIKLWNIIWPF